jgi:HPt (histidine-containing phosphotransfer) domain-containing protein/ActR/RegA family two-component response regulator
MAQNSVLIFSENNHQEVVAKVKGFNVLIVEDNEQCMTQMKKLLEAHGYTVTACNSVSDALYTLHSASAAQFDVCIIDFDGSKDTQMVNGLLDKINVDRSGKLKQYTSILGLFSNNKPQNKEVDLWLKKPVNASQFMESFEQCLDIALNHSDSVDIGLALELSGGDPEFLKELLTELVQTGKSQLSNLQTSISSLDWNAINHEAHSLKGASAQLGCKPLAHAAFVIERAAKAQQAENLNSFYATLEKRLNNLEQFLNNMNI